MFALVLSSLLLAAGPSMVLHSPSFDDGDPIPSAHTCDGTEVPPPLAWSGVPRGTRSLVLVVDDPDAPGGTWVHWLVYNLPPSALNLSAGEALPDGARQGLNSWKKAGYGGPCPPSGRHRYRHRLYALDTVLPEQDSLSKAALEQAMQGHIIEVAELVGTYQRTR